MFQGLLRGHVEMFGVPGRQEIAIFMSQVISRWG